MTLFIIALLLIAALGYLAQTTGLCMVRGVNEAVSGKPLFLLAILFSGVFAWVSILIAHVLDIPIPFISYDVSILAVIGGFLFGLGAAFNNGCGVSTISRLARGHSQMLTTIVGWLIGWLLFTNFIPALQPANFQISPMWHYGFLFILSIVIVLLVSRFNKNNKKIWLGMLTIGLMASIVFFYEPKWTPSGLLNGISKSLWNNDSAQWPSTERFILIAGLIGGMVAAALHTRSFKLSLSTWKGYLKHLSAGILMGIGAVTASGGNDSQLLLALPSCSPAGVTTVIFILLGIYLGRRIVNE